MTRDYIKRKRQYGRKKRAPVRRKARVPRAMTSTHAVFPFSRTYVLKTDTTGKLNGVCAVGNVQLCGMDVFLESAGTLASTTVLSAEYAAAGFTPKSKWPVQIANLANIYSTARIVKHQIDLIPICSAGASNAVPLLVTYTKYGTDGTVGAAYSLAEPLTDYLSNAPGSKLMAPSHERMSGVSRSYFPSKNSVSDNSEFLLPTSQSSALLTTSTADTNNGRTLGFFKLFAEDCGEKDAAGNFVQTPIYRVIERITLSCSNRRAT